ncbi:type II toxin-antitoxin system HicB family antitoxin [Methylovulum psychrotolerans]|uniref:Type II toxin-antitoxin system HicB family antitoxin n=1 Tax=Methylovulum psychrotolerans TaxID=1704499 RepID=A0A2S5CSW2_9GAMM|nr:type II toxin-antitoxin system HicB family antitoxin [Methylovulum psychrotolerans]POZ53894.1 hypothetical protein AADEFJLK_00936 [Methylovulum psychrotolerans]
MKHAFTLEYWQDNGGYAGRLKEVQGVFSQGETLQELEENIEDAYKLLMEDESSLDLPIVQFKQVLLETEGQTAYRLMQQSGFIGCMEGDGLFSENYKSFLG